MDARPRMLAALVAGVLPWTVVVTGQVSLVFAFGLLDPHSLHLTTVWDYLFVYTRGLPQFLLAWPVSTLLYLGGLASAALAWAGREDRRVTAGLFALAGASQLWVAWGFTQRRTTAAFPLGAAFLFALAWLAAPTRRDPGVYSRR